MHAGSPRLAFFSVALSAAAVALVLPPSVHWPQGPPPTAAGMLRAAAPLPSLAPVALGYHRAVLSRPAPLRRAAPEFSDDVEAARPVPKPVPRPVPARTYTAPPVTPTAPAEPARTAAAPSPSPSPSYTDLPSPSGAYGSAQAYAESLVGAAQFACLKPLWERESTWSVTAENSASGAYGIPQALPGSKMASAGPDWATNPDTQVRWGVSYIDEIYGSPCGAWAHEEADGWY